MPQVPHRLEIAVILQIQDALQPELQPHDPSKLYHSLYIIQRHMNILDTATLMIANIIVFHLICQLHNQIPLWQRQATMNDIT